MSISHTTIVGNIANVNEIGNGYGGGIYFTGNNTLTIGNSSDMGFRVIDNTPDDDADGCDIGAVELEREVFNDGFKDAISAGLNQEPRARSPGLLLVNLVQPIGIHLH